MRHRRSLGDLGLLFAGLGVLLFLALELDIFLSESAGTARAEGLELDEALALGACLAVGLLVFSIRRHREQKREMHRRLVAEQQIRALAYEDPLTGLPNRRRFDEALAVALAAPPGAGLVHAVLMLDLNGFKRINDVHGHGVGDEALMVVAQRLLGALPPGDLVARLGGDEFAILAQHLPGAEAAMNLALRVIEALAPPVAAGEAQHALGTGIGIALIPRDGDTAAAVLRRADVALYRAKAERRSALRFFEAEMDHHVRERAQLEQELRAALEADAIRPVFRPTVELRSGRVVGFAADPHWAHPRLGTVPAERFLAIAEETGLIHRLADRLLRHALAAARGWPDGVVLSLALLPSQLRDAGLVQRIVAALQEAGLDPARLELEVAESTLVQELQAAQQVLGALREHRIRIALGNFGTGYSSLYHLRNFRLDKIRIDRGFVESLQDGGESARIVSALVGLGQGLGITVTADGVGSEAQQRALLGTGCEQGQGFLFSEAVPAEQTARFFDAAAPRP